MNATAKTICLIFLCCVAPCLVISQKSLHVKHGCAYKTAAEDATLYTFEPSGEAERIVSEICNAMGVSQNFDIRSSNVENALATTEGGRRVILYSTVFLKKFSEDARTRWAAYSVLAHEIGHHFNGHDFSVENPAERKKMELEADRFSGSAMRLLGASLEEAKAGLETFALDAEQKFHPPARGRIEALANGWKQMQERIEKVGGGTVSPATGVPIERDSDGDGIPDRNDACPEEYGRSLTAGCPDGDEDGIPDGQDKCPYRKGPSNWQGCPDSDADGLPDHEDQCPRQPGQLVDKGCPPPDRDGDSVADRVDKCPDVSGLIRYQGCPDSDGDGVPDHKDKCPREKGDPLYGGCANAQAEDGMAAPDPLGLVLVKGGTFKMGCTSEQQDCYGHEKPIHDVTLSDFYIGKFEVTQQIWQDIMGSNPSTFNKYPQCPVESVSWEDAQKFLKKLNQKYPGKNYRLPTEAEWEYAARGGGKAVLFGNGKNIADPDEMNFNANANFQRNYSMVGKDRSKTVPVGSLNTPNALGLHDMSGNVWEWCSDWYGDYSSGSQTNPTGPASGAGRVLRGGSWHDTPQDCRVALRFNNAPDNRSYYLGFRLAKTR